MEPRIKSELWVQAQVRLCDRQAIPIVVVRRGDPDSGAILVRVDNGRGGVVVWTQVYTADGRRGWMRGTGPAPVAAEVAEDYVARAIDRDYDVWIVDVEDRSGRFELDGPVV